MSELASRRPALVTAVAALVAVAGAVVLASGLALIVERGNELVQIPLLLARVDESLPFDNGQDLGIYVAVIGSLVAVSGLVLALLALGIARGRSLAYVVVVVLVGSLTVFALVLRSTSADDLARLFLGGAAAALGLLLVLVLVLLVGRRSRTWVLGRSRTV